MLNWFKWKVRRRPWMEMSFGELIDKRAILRVKLDKLTNKSDLKMIAKQVRNIEEYLFPAVDYYLDEGMKDHLISIMAELQNNHYTCWECEDQVLSSTDVRKGIKAAKHSRLLNTIRAKIKREIDLIFGEKFLEVSDEILLEITIAAGVHTR